MSKNKKNELKKAMIINRFLFFGILFSLFLSTNVLALDGTGGNITHDGEYTIHTFKSNGTFVPPTIINVSVLVVAGGGGGGGASRAGTGNAGGGGGGTSGQVGYSPYNGKAAYGGNPGNQTSAGADASCDAANTAGGQGAL